MWRAAVTRGGSAPQGTAERSSVRQPAVTSERTPTAAPFKPPLLPALRVAHLTINRTNEKHESQNDSVDRSACPMLHTKTEQVSRDI